VELREENSTRLGLDWDAWKRNVGGQFTITGNTFEGSDGFVRLDSLLSLDASILANFLNYTVQTGNARLLQRSRLNASNLEPAVISDVKRVPYQEYVRTERAQTILTETNPKVDSFQEYDPDDELATAKAPRVVTIVPPVHNRLTTLNSDEEGLLIRIQPVIGLETVTAKIDIDLNTVTGFDRNDRPIVTEQKLANLFTLHNGKQILLGTLERQTVVDARRGIPGLKSIPVLKYLFSVEAQRVERSRVFILATPRFSNVGFSAKTIADLRNNVPALSIVDRDVVLDDGKLIEPAQLAK
jgi:type II secretory pathway component GspD/PulD (secretin)